MTKIIDITTHPKYKPIVSQMVLIVYNSWKPDLNNNARKVGFKGLDDWQIFEYYNAIDILKAANANSQST